MTELDRRRREWLARTGPLSSGIAPLEGDWIDALPGGSQEMPVSEEAWKVLPLYEG